MLNLPLRHACRLCHPLTAINAQTLKWCYRAVGFLRHWALQSGLQSSGPQPQLHNAPSNRIDRIKHTPHDTC